MTAHERVPDEGVPEATLRELLLWVVRRRSRFVVTGASMSPTLCAGEMVLVDRRSSVSERSIVVARHPTEDGLRMVKRVAFLDDTGAAYLSSDNAEALDAADSRRFGMVPAALIEGCVTARVRTPG